MVAANRRGVAPGTEDEDGMMATSWGSEATNPRGGEDHHDVAVLLLMQARRGEAGGHDNDEELGGGGSAMYMEEESGARGKGKNARARPGLSGEDL